MLRQRLRRHRRLVSALLAGLATLSLASAVSARGVSTAPVVVAASDVLAGAALVAGDVRVVQWPVDLVPAGAFASVDQVEGETSVTALMPGEPITVTRLLGARSAPGRAAVPVRVRDAELTGVLRPGDRVDVVLAAVSPPRRIATDARVLTVPRRSGTVASTSSVVVLDVADTIAPALAAVSEPVALIIR